MLSHSNYYGVFFAILIWLYDYSLDLLTINTHGQAALNDPTHLVLIVCVLGIELPGCIAPCVASQALVGNEAPDRVQIW